MKWPYLLSVALLALTGFLLGVVVATPKDGFSGEVAFVTVQTQDGLHLQSESNINVSSILDVDSKSAFTDSSRLFLNLGPTWSSVVLEQDGKRSTWHLRSDHIVEYRPK